MKMIQKLYIRFMALLCKLFDVTPHSLNAGRRGNLPPPQGSEGTIWV